MKKIVFIPLFIFTLYPFSSAGAQPLETIKSAVDQAVMILNDPQYKDGFRKDIQRDEIWLVIRQVFDLEGIARITLARNWPQFTPAEKEEFTEVFGRFLGDNYVEKIQSGFRGERVEYLAQEIIDDRRSTVKTKIASESMEIPVDYRMHKRGSDWLIYDVLIEGVSLIKNYRTQFASILMKNTPQELINTIKQKL